MGYSTPKRGNAAFPLRAGPRDLSEVIGCLLKGRNGNLFLLILDTCCGGAPDVARGAEIKPFGPTKIK